MPDFEIHTLDLHFQNYPETIAAYLVVGPGGPVLVETGPGSTLPALEAGLAQHGVTAGDVRDVLLSHIHLDHAGASGWWARQGARLHVHKVGAPHLVRPERLLASAQRIYGELMEPLWGQFLAAPADRVHALEDRAVIEAGGLRFTAHDTPGHAGHHMVYQLGEVLFTGDLAGIRLAGRPHLALPTPPPEFDLTAWLDSIARVRRLPSQRLYLTHFGPVDEPGAHWSGVEALLAETTAFVEQALARGLERDAILDEFIGWDRSRQAAQGLDADTRACYDTIGPAGMSVDGILRYLVRRSRPGSR